jgi:hypothetical protein
VIAIFFTFSRYVYRFVCDLQSILGYSPEELHAMVGLKPTNPATSSPASMASSLDLGDQVIKKEMD